MGLQLGDAIGIAVDLEIEAPVLIDAGLPAALAFIVLLGRAGPGDSGFEPRS
jgi:hypothetical protein